MWGEKGFNINVSADAKHDEDFDMACIHMIYEMNGHEAYNLNMWLTDPEGQVLIQINFNEEHPEYEPLTDEQYATLIQEIQAQFAGTETPLEIIVLPQ